MKEHVSYPSPIDSCTYMSFLLIKQSKKLRLRSLYRQALLKNQNHKNKSANINSEYFIAQFSNELDDVRERIDEELKIEICSYLQRRLDYAFEEFQLIIPQNAEPIHYSPSSSDSSTSSEESNGEAEAEAVNLEASNPPPLPAPQEEPETSHSFDFEKFKTDIIRTLSALTDPSHRHDGNANHNQSKWNRHTIETLTTTAALCGIRRRTYGHWFLCQ